MATQELKPSQTLAGFSLGRYWQTQLRASSDRTHQPSRQILEERLWVDPGKLQSSSLDRFDGRHWEILSGRHLLSSSERRWRHRAQSSQTSAGFSSGRYWQTQLRTSSDRTHQPIRHILEERLWVDPERHQVAPVDRFGKKHSETLRKDID